MRHRIAFTVSFLVTICLVTGACAQTGGLLSFDSIGTPVAQRMAKWVKAMNSGDTAVWRTYTNDDIRPGGDSAQSAARRFAAFGHLHEEYGVVEPIRVQTSEPYHIAVLMHALNPYAGNDYIVFDLIADSLPPYRTMQLGLMPGVDPSISIPDGVLTEEQLGEVVGEFVSNLVAKDRFSGAVLLAKDDKVIYSGAFGEACKRYGVPNRLDTKFNLGSMNKMFTGVAICQLAEQGKLKFTDTVGMYLPDYPNEDVRNKVTIHELLTHTSGLGSYWEEVFDTKFWRITTVQQFAELFWEKPLEFQPGERFGYSNSGPIVLGLILEKITGQSYYDYIREHVTGPAGMSSTECYEAYHPVENLAIGYTHQDFDGNRSDAWFNNFYMHGTKGGPAGGGFSTVGDLLKFRDALKHNVLLSPAYTDTLITGKVDMMGGLRYGYLFGDEDINGHRAVGHNGGAPGISAVLRMYWDDGWTIAVLSNYDMAAEQVATFVDELVTR